MPELDEFYNASLEDMKKGYCMENDILTCLICGETMEKGIIYQEASAFFEAEKYMKMHIEKKHGSVFDFLINLDKKVTGLSEHQQSLIKLFYEGKSNNEIQEELKIGSTSTIRNHRFLLREKERQSKIFLLLMELLNSQNKIKSKPVEPHKTAKMVDDRYKVSEDENEKLLSRYFPEGLDGPLKTFHMKEKSKIVVLRELAKRFHEERTYTEKEVNELLKAAYEDYATLRRYLIEYGFMDRKADCSAYWVKEKTEKRHKEMDRRRELKMEYKELKTEGGVYQVRNTKNNKLLVLATPNFKTMDHKKISLKGGTFFPYKELEKEIAIYGPDAFVFEILETLEEKEDSLFGKKDELKKMHEKWLEKLQPYGDKGYNIPKYKA